MKRKGNIWLSVAMATLCVVMALPSAWAMPLRIAHNDAGSLELHLGGKRARNGQDYSGKGDLAASGDIGDAAACVYGEEPLLPDSDWTVTCNFTSPQGIDRAFNGMLLLGRPSEAIFNANTFHYVSMHWYLDSKGRPGGWVHGENHSMWDMSFSPEVRASFDGRDTFAIRYDSSAKKLTVTFSNGQAKSSYTVNARKVRDFPRPYFVYFGTPIPHYCGPAKWTVHSLAYAGNEGQPAYSPEGAPAMVPAPKQMEWTSPESWFAVDESAAVDGARPGGVDVGSLVDQLAKKVGRSVAAKGGGKIIVGEPRNGHRTLDAFCEREGVYPPRNPEGYLISVRPDAVYVIGSTPAGTFYGVQTLVGMVEKRSDGRWGIRSALVRDWPDFPFRCMYIEAGSGWDSEESIREIAQKRINILMPQTNAIWDADKPEATAQFKRACDLMRKYHIEPAPVIWGFGHGDEVGEKNPNWLEGIWVKDEKLTLSGVPGPVPLAHPNVIQTKSAGIVVTDAQGKAYQESKDYRIIPGDMNPFASAPGKPFAIQRIPGGRIPESTTVLVSYNYVPRRDDEGHDLSLCPAEPELYGYLERLVTTVVETLKPRYLMIARDEAYRMRSDSRCLLSGKNAAELFAWDVQRMFRFARRVDPKIEVLMWEDAISPYHNGYGFAAGPTLPAVDMIPRSIIPVVWFYGNFEKPVSEASVEFFQAKGFRVLGGPAKFDGNIRNWVDIAWTHREGETGMPGLVLTPWEGPPEGIDTFAARLWNHAENGQPEPKP